MQTDRSTFNISATQTRPFQSNQTTQTFPQQNTQAIQTDLGLNENLTLDSTDSSTSFPQDQQNSSELLDNNILMTETRPILETYEQQLQTFQMSQTFETLATDCRAVNVSDINQPAAQTVSHHNENTANEHSTKSSYGSGGSNKISLVNQVLLPV